MNKSEEKCTLTSKASECNKVFYLLVHCKVLLPTALFYS